MCLLVNKRDANSDMVPFDEEDEGLLHAVLRAAGLAIENYQLHAENTTSRAGLRARRESSLR